MRAATRFHVINARTWYHLLLGDPGFTDIKRYPYISPMPEGHLDGPEGYISASNCPFQQDNAYSSDAAFFNELAEDGEIVPARPEGVPLSKWRTLRNKNQKPKELYPHPPDLLNL